jgi:MoaA/NifB/PqqE/SkfB family radical SAM enzyme
MVGLATQLGCHGVRFGHLMFTPEIESHGLNLSPGERRAVERRIRSLQRQSRIPVAIAPGYYDESPVPSCAPLDVEEFNVDYRGTLTLCCQLSGYSGTNDGHDVMGRLDRISLAEACVRFRERVARYRADKARRAREGTLGELDRFPCWYCVNYLGKVPPGEPYAASGWMTSTPPPSGSRVIPLHLVPATP